MVIMLLVDGDLMVVVEVGVMVMELILIGEATGTMDAVDGIEVGGDSLFVS
jgi:hypothetical protein